MLPDTRPTILLASHDPDLLARLELLAAASGAEVRVAMSCETALSALLSPRLPDLALLDAELPDAQLDQLLASARGATGGYRYPIVLLSDTVSKEWRARLQEGALDDLIPRSPENPHWRVRIDAVLRSSHRMRDLEQLRATMALNAQTDSLTKIYNRSTMLSMLFRETDRVQRMKTPLCLLLMDIDDFGHWNTRLGMEACDELLCEVVERTQRLLRSYDILGRAGKDEMLMILPGCTTVDAVLLAERLRMDVFARPFHVAGEAIRMSACFGVSASDGRSPVVVLREAELSLQQAKENGPESVQCFGNCPQTKAPVAFLSATSGDELLAW
jgi:two-component system, cell cycle response regulator